ncbi:hypothetical protein SAMN04487934_106143 [Eubacterium ruminantium]|nr:hypothetical protein SAMN04487934_106143 [Eubacterium ruminantium]
MEQTMKKIGLEMNICMSIVMSVFLSLAGMLSSGHFAIPGYLISLAVSIVISLIIGFLVPMGKVNMSLERKMNLRPGSMKARCIESLISDFIYTPIMTICMVSLAYMKIKKESHGHADVPFVPMFLKSLAICLVVGYLLIFIFQPLIMNMLFKKHNVEPSKLGGPAGGPGGRPPQGPPTQNR